MKRFGVVTLFPDMIRTACGYGVLGRARTGGRIQVQTWNPRDFARDRHRTVDDRPYGGGPGMVMSIEPLRTAIRRARRALGATRTLYLSPQGSLLDHARVAALAEEPALLLVAGRYEGVDERLLELEIDEECSIGDYVLSGGELPALVLIDAVARQVPGVLGAADSAEQDSFVDGLLDCPHYTRPESYRGLPVPQVLLSGDHAAIARWRLKQSLGRTWQRRPDLLAGQILDAGRRALLDEYIRELPAADETAANGKQLDEQVNGDEQHH